MDCRTFRVAAIAVAGCSRTPPEPSAPPPQSAAPVATATLAPASARPETATVAIDAGVPAPAREASPSAEPRCIAKPPAAPPKPAAPAPKGACPPDPGGPSMATAKISFPDAPRAPSTLEVELAKTNAESARGLMYRRSMPDAHGMLFDLHTKKIQTFWMHNTCIPLDMLFVDEDGLIVGILEEVPVLNDEERNVECPSRYVLEVNAGFTRKYGIKAGQRVKLP
ncbi:MAG: DUF192 domain-containing protein [Polyangiaceae bacterium]